MTCPHSFKKVTAFFEFYYNLIPLIILKNRLILENWKSIRHNLDNVVVFNFTMSKNSKITLKDRTFFYFLFYLNIYFEQIPFYTRINTYAKDRRLFLNLCENKLK